jgi:hypothetical protein
MNQERDLLPWILGGLSATAVAVAFIALSTHKTVVQNAPLASLASLVASQPLAMPASRAPAPAPPPAPAAPESALLPEPATESDPAQVFPPEPVRAAIHAEPEGGQIWACTTQGVKTFSNNPCGENSTLLDVGPINTMNATPLNGYPRSYEQEPRYAPAYDDQAPVGEEYSEQYGSEARTSSYAMVQGWAFVPRRRLEHPHRPPLHHHRPLPVRRY